MRYLGNRSKRPTSQAGDGVKIAAFGATGSDLKAIFTHRPGAWLPVCFVMGPGWSEEPTSRCYKYFSFQLEVFFWGGLSARRSVSRRTVMTVCVRVHAAGTVLY